MTSHWVSLFLRYLLHLYNSNNSDMKLNFLQDDSLTLEVQAIEYYSHLQCSTRGQGWMDATSSWAFVTFQHFGTSLISSLRWALQAKWSIYWPILWVMGLLGEYHQLRWPPGSLWPPLGFFKRMEFLKNAKKCDLMRLNLIISKLFFQKW